MENVSFREVDSTEEICKVFNRVIDNQNQIEGKLLMLISESKKPKKKHEKKGMASMKALLMVFAMAVIMVFASSVSGYVASDINDDIASNHVLLAQYLRDTVGAGTFAFTPQSAPTAGSISQGLVYFDSGVNLLKVSLDGTNFSTIDTAGGVSLDGAYDFGSAGGGRTILATDGAVQITNTQNDTASLLGLTYSGNTTGDGLTITMSVGSGDAIEIENTGTGLDIEGTGANFTVSKAGAVVGVVGTWTGDQTWTGSSANIVFDATDDELLVEDDAILSFGDAADVTMTWNASNLLIEAATDNTGQIIIGSTNAMDVVINNDAADSTILADISAEALILNGWDVTINDDDVLNFGDSKEFSVEYDEDSTDNLLVVALNANDAVQFGDGSSSSTDVKMMAGTDDDFVLFDSSADELFFEDCDLKINEGSQIEFAVADNSIDWTIDISTDEVLLFLPTETTDDQSFNIGDATNTSDVRFFGATASTVIFDASADNVIFNAYDIQLNDDDVLAFGDGKDVIISQSSANLLTIGQTAAGTGAVAFGVDDAGLDVTFFGDTTALSMLWDTSGNVLSLDGGTAMLEFRGASIDAHETTLAVVEPTASNIVTLPDDTGSLTYMAEAGSVAFGPTGTIPVTDAVVLYTSTGADAITLPDGVSPGQILSIVLVAQAGGNATLTPTSVTGSGWATMVFTNIGESASFMYIDSTIGWTVLGTSGVSTQPLITQ